MKLIENGVVNPTLTMLVRMQGFTIPPSPPAEWLNELLQKEWVRAKDGVFRAQLGGRFPTEEELELLKQLGVVGGISIKDPSQYRGVLLLGATLKSMARRLRFLLDEHVCFVDFPPLWVLVSQRRLILEQEGPQCLPSIMEETGLTLAYGWKHCEQTWPFSESGIAKFLIQYSGINEFIGHEVVVASNVNAGGVSSRPANTAETVCQWLKEVEPTLRAASGHYLVLSSQPFCENQRMAVERAVREVMRNDFTFDVCGPEAPPLPLSRWLDNLAKQLWEEVELLKFK